MMLYEIAHFIRDKFGIVWEWLEMLNAWAFSVRYRKGLAQIPSILAGHPMRLKGGDEVMGGSKSVCFRLANPADARSLAAFFACQPEECYTYFRPHLFDAVTLSSLIARKSFIVILATEDDQIVGYSFLRSFVHGSAYLGKMVDVNWQGRGIGKQMCLIAMEVATTLGVHMYESINKNNLASAGSSSVLRQVLVRELEDGDCLYEDLPL